MPRSNTSWVKSLPLAVLLAALGAAVAWGSTQSTVKDTAAAVSKLEERELEHVERIGRMESKIDLIHEAVQRIEQRTD